MNDFSYAVGEAIYKVFEFGLIEEVECSISFLVPALVIRDVGGGSREYFVFSEVERRGVVYINSDVFGVDNVREFSHVKCVCENELMLLE